MSEIEKGRKDMMGAKEDFSKIFDFHDPTLNEKYSKRKEPVSATKETGLGAQLDEKPEGWITSWTKGRKRVATSPISFHADELIPMVQGLAGNSKDLPPPFRDKDGQLFGGTGLKRRGPQYGLTLDVRLSSLLGDVKRGDDMVDCYIRGLETPDRRKHYALQQPPARSYGLSGSRDRSDRELRDDRTIATQQATIDKYQTQEQSKINLQKANHQINEQDTIIKNLTQRIKMMEINMKKVGGRL